MSDDFDSGHDLPASAPVVSKPAPTESFSAALAALVKPPKVGDVIEHDGKDVAIIGTQIRGPGDFSVLIDGGVTLHSR
jgi:hypothetical protein